jgi:hypothetical protein
VDATLTPRARIALMINAVVAWAGIGLTLLFSGLGWYRRTPVEPGLYGDTPAGALPRLVGTLSYFTIWSNIAVAVGVTLLLARPLRATLVRRTLRLSGLFTITVTAIVYQVLLAPTVDVEGWSLLTDPVLHVVTPALTVLVWLVWGPRGWVDVRVVPAALVVPLPWIAWMLARGAVVDAYPYGFTNVVERGYADVAVTLALILVFGLVVAAVYWALDVLLRRRAGATPTPRSA